jgi:hypothetical protein
LQSLPPSDGQFGSQVRSNSGTYSPDSCDREHLGRSHVANRPLSEMLAFVKEHGLEEIVAKRADSVYQPGLRTGLWARHRIKQTQKFVIGGTSQVI